MGRKLCWKGVRAIINNYLLYNEDCLTALKKLEDNSVDFILTAPPYNLGQFMLNRGTRLYIMRPNQFVQAGWDNTIYDEWLALINQTFKELSRVARIGASCIVFMSIIKVESVIELATKHGFYYKTTGIWHKTNPMPRNMNLHFVNSTEPWIYFTYKKKTGTFNNAGKVIHDYIETPITKQSEKKFGKHPTQKPVELLEFFVNTLSNENDTVLDPFCGSGSTGVAATQNNRKFIGIELNKAYFNIASNRITNV